MKNNPKKAVCVHTQEPFPYTLAMSRNGYKVDSRNMYQIISNKAWSAPYRIKDWRQE